MLISHSRPVYPGGQLQEKLLMRSVQVAPFKQGLESHSFMSISQFTPVNEKKLKTTLE